MNKYIYLYVPRRDALRLQKERERLQKEHTAQQEYAKRMAEEAKKRADAENLIELLEQEEKDLIDRLRRTQRLQQQAYGVLQNSLEC